MLAFYGRTAWLFSPRRLVRQFAVLGKRGASWPGLSRPSRLGTHCALLSGMPATSAGMTAEIGAAYAENARKVSSLRNLNRMARARPTTAWLDRRQSTS